MPVLGAPGLRAHPGMKGTAPGVMRLTLKLEVPAPRSVQAPPLRAYSQGSNIKTSYIQAGSVQLGFLLLISQLSRHLWDIHFHS